jgi:RNA:NAD 2'-phosphotransferase (TPT1/KptA family)
MEVIYHGTSTEYLQAIAKEGLLPREVTGVKSNWKY